MFVNVLCFQKLCEFADFYPTQMLDRFDLTFYKNAFIIAITSTLRILHRTG